MNKLDDVLAETIGAMSAIAIDAKVAEAKADAAKRAAGEAKLIALQARERQMTPGPQGDQGIKGDRGDAGIQGERGLTGAAGEQGIEGKRGLTGAPGDVGRRGPRGERGLIGAPGVDGKAGAAIVWRGEWSATARYNLNDAVGFDGSSWIAIRGSTNVVPPGDAWNLLAAEGRSGGVGSDGAAGAPGIQGLPGLNGEDGADGDDASTYAAENKNGTTLLAGQPVATHTSGTGVVAASAANGTLPCVGLIVADTIASVSGDVRTDGIVTMADWSAVIGAVSLTRGRYYLDPVTPGMLTQVAPTSAGQLVQAVGYAVDASRLDISFSTSIRL